MNFILKIILITSSLLLTLWLLIQALAFAKDNPNTLLIVALTMIALSIVGVFNKLRTKSTP